MSLNFDEKCPKCNSILATLTHKNGVRSICLHCGYTTEEWETTSATTSTSTAVNSARCPICGELMEISEGGSVKVCKHCLYTEKTWLGDPPYLPPEEPSVTGPYSYGWVCPKCGAVMAPWQDICPHCMPPMELTCTY